ncbi:hypothetical protein [Xanthobacter sp. KR7-225]|uniref:hypothetical protein n=1 Tax=Xanthobacter sp. KR7-225 TaxID=3156613 RepID=UPI0032B441C9
MGPLGMTRFRGAGLVLSAALAAAMLHPGAALALMPPYVYQTARDDAASVIVIAVEAVKAPKRVFGNCTVDGTIAKVERGTTYQPGQKVSLEVPCAAPDAYPPIGGTIYQNLPDLKASKFGRAYLDAVGKVVLSQYEQLAAVP